jgi:hypothetical protein
MALGMNALGPDLRLGGLFLGFGTGYVLMLSRFPFSAKALVRDKYPRPFILLARYALGSAGAVLLHLGLETVVLWEITPYALTHFLHYAVLGFWATAGAPWLFLHLGLAAPGPKTR